jgi:hypothetical protein
MRQTARRRQRRLRCSVNEWSEPFVALAAGVRVSCSVAAAAAAGQIPAIETNSSSVAKTFFIVKLLFYEPKIGLSSILFSV